MYIFTADMGISIGVGAYPHILPCLTYPSLLCVFLCIGRLWKICHTCILPRHSSYLTDSASRSLRRNWTSATWLAHCRRSICFLVSCSIWTYSTWSSYSDNCWGSWSTIRRMPTRLTTTVC